MKTLEIRQVFRIGNDDVELIENIVEENLSVYRVIDKIPIADSQTLYFVRGFEILFRQVIATSLTCQFKIGFKFGENI